MLETLPPARRRLVLLLVGAVALLVVATAAWVLLRPGPAEVDQAVPGPIVLVPGYGGQPDSLEGLREQIAAAGRDAVVLDTPGNGTGDLEAQADALGDLVDDTLRRYDAGSVDLVGYSAGGVVSRLYVRDGGGRDVVRRVVTLGSPHHGTDTAALALGAAGSCPPACQQLAPDSDLLRRLNAGDETPSGPQWTTLRTADDETVVPVGSAELDGALNVLLQDVCPDATTTHAQLPSDPLVPDLLALSLGAEDPLAPGPGACGAA